MKKPTFAAKAAAVASAILLVVAFVGCPSRSTRVMPTISPVMGNFNITPAAQPPREAKPAP